MDKPDRTVARASKYQYVINERLSGSGVVDPELFPNIWHNDPHAGERRELQAHLFARLMVIAEEVCTEIQWKILSMYVKGVTQVEISKIMKNNQSSVVKALIGNIDYKRDGKRRTYGGAYMKMRKVAATDPECQRLLQAINDLGSD